MKVLVPATKEPLYKAGVAVYLDPGDPTAYWQFWADIWATGESVIVVEHDIIPSGSALAELIECPNHWCTQPYPYFVGPYRGLGCVKFTSQLMVSTPMLWEKVAAFDDPGHPSKHWCRLDSWSQIVLGQMGFLMCRHHTEVAHANRIPSHGCVGG